MSSFWGTKFPLEVIQRTVILPSSSRYSCSNGFFYFHSIQAPTLVYACFTLLRSALAVTQLRTPSGQNLHAHTPSCTPSTMGTPRHSDQSPWEMDLMSCERQHRIPRSPNLSSSQTFQVFSSIIVQSSHSSRSEGGRSRILWSVHLRPALGDVFGMFLTMFS